MARHPLARHRLARTVAMAVAIVAGALAFPRGATPAGRALDRQVPANLLAMGSSQPAHALLVDKSAEKLFLYDVGDGPPRLIRAWNATTGQNGGDKTLRGDHRTPEGIYFFTEVLEDHELPAEYGVRALVMDYPNLFDRRERKTGDGIWLHGTDEIIRPLTPMRTRGCVVVTNRDMDEISRLVRLEETPIVVEQNVDQVDAERWREMRQELTGFIDRWTTAWRTKEHVAYAKCYAPTFQADGNDRARWLAQKRGVADVAGRLEIELGKPTLLRRGSQAIARFSQYYASDVLADYGIKTLWLEHAAGGWQIVSESWRPAHPSPAMVARLEQARGRQSEPAQSEPAQTEPAQSGPAQTEPAQSATRVASHRRPTSAPTEVVADDQLEPAGDADPWHGWSEFAVGVELPTPDPVPDPVTRKPRPQRRPGAANGPAAELTIDRFLAEAGDGEVHVSFRLESKAERTAAARGSVVIVVKVGTQEGDRYLAWPFGARLVAGSPVAPIRGDSFAIRRFKEVSATLQGLPAEGVLQKVSVLVYDAAGRELLARSFGL